tara:strand:- start:437 stop:1054 length:618 start_codon:yes stop_codon:yes gene_type:complete
MIFIAISYPFSKEIVTYLIEIISLEMEMMAVFSPTEFIRLRVYLSLITAVLISHPLWYRGVYKFSRQGLEEQEKKVLIVSFTLGTILFLIGSVIGLLYFSPFLFEILLEENDAIGTSLSVYQSVKLLVSISLFSGILTSLPVLILLIADYIPNRETLRKYVYILIIIVVALGTPEPSMLINLLFLIFFVIIMEITMLFLGDTNEN